MQMAPVERTPTVVTDIDPLAGARAPGGRSRRGLSTAPAPRPLDRLYRPRGAGRAGDGGAGRADLDPRRGQGRGIGARGRHRAD